MCRRNMRGRIPLLTAYVVPTLAVLPAYCGGQPNSMSGVLFLRPSPTSAGTAKTHRRLVRYTYNHAVSRISRSLCISLALRLVRLLPVSRSSSASRYSRRSVKGAMSSITLNRHRNRRRHPVQPSTQSRPRSRGVSSVAYSPFCEVHLAHGSTLTMIASRDFHPHQSACAVM